MKKYLSMIHLYFKYSLVKEMEYKFNFIFGGLFELIWLFMYVVLVNVIFLNVTSLGGWSKYQVLFLTFQGGLMDSLFTFLIVPGLSQLPTMIRMGTLDFLLLKPINKIFYISINDFSIPQIKNVIINLAGIIFCIYKLQIKMSVIRVAIYILLSIAGFTVIYCMMFLLMSLAFWVVKLDIVMGLGSQLIMIGNKPRTIYPSVLQKILMYGFPVLVAFNFPVLFSLSQLSIFNIMMAFVMTAVWIVLSKIIFQRGLRKYVSASS